MYQNTAGYGQQAPMPVTRARPEWAQRLLTLHGGRIARQFVLHFNINDYIVDLSRGQHADVAGGTRFVTTPDVFGDWEDDKPPTFREYLHELLFSANGIGDYGCQAIYTYTLASGMLANDRAHRGIGQPLTEELGGATALVRGALSRVGGGQSQAGHPDAGKEVGLPDSVPANLKILGHMLRQRHMAQNQRGEEIEAPIAVVLDYCEKLIPSLVGEGQGTRDQLQALETVQSWALDPRIRDTKNVIILLTTNRGHLAANVFGEGSGTRELRVPLPDEPSRLAFIRRKKSITNPRQRLARISQEFAPRTTSDQNFTPAEGLARATQGMRLMDIDGLNRETVMKWMETHQVQDPNLAVGSAGAEIEVSAVREAKGETIERQSADLLEIIPPERGFNEIGGMVKLKSYLSVRTDMMARGKHSPLIPSGLLLAGPPGTGKTIIAEALATEGKFNLVKMRNIQDRWVGSSERNLDMVLNLLQDLHPVVVFVDEIDQAMGQRSTGQSGDSGVSARMFARILQEMSKAKNRGRILWVAATNRTDLLDDALLRRFDRVVPLLAPDAIESRRIFAAMPWMISKQSDKFINITYGDDLAQSNRKDQYDRPAPTEADLEKFKVVAEKSAGLGLTGAEIEIVVRRAVEIAAERMLREQQQNGQRAADDADNDLPPIASKHLIAAMNDFKINHNPDMYDYQSLLAIRSCNFYSILPQPLPDRAIFSEIVASKPAVDELGEPRLDERNQPIMEDQVEPTLLDEAIRRLADKLRPESQRAEEARRQGANDQQEQRAQWEQYDESRRSRGL